MKNKWILLAAKIIIPTWLYIIICLLSNCTNLIATGSFMIIIMTLFVFGYKHIQNNIHDITARYVLSEWVHEEDCGWRTIQEEFRSITARYFENDNVIEVVENSHIALAKKLHLM